MVPKFTYFEATASALLSSGAESVRPDHSPGRVPGTPAPLFLGWALLPKGRMPDLFWKSLSCFKESHGYLGRAGERQGRATEGQEEGTMGTKAMTLLRDAVTHGT